MGLGWIFWVYRIFINKKADCMKSFNKCKLCPFITTESMASFRRSIKSCLGSFKVSNISLILVFLLVFETKICLS